MSPPITFDSRGLVPVVAQDRFTGEVRMLAWATREAIDRTIASGRATFFSRSRNELWEKGKSSGNALQVAEVRVDCDHDAVLYLVDPVGPTCHTGAASCFYRAEDGVEVGPATTLLRLDAVVASRRTATAETSYTKSLFDGGTDKIGTKLREEADELARAVAGEDDARVVAEAADVLFHTIVALRARGVGIDAVLRELDRREGTSGHAEKKARAPE